MMTLKDRIERIVNRNDGVTTAEIDREVRNQYARRHLAPPPYSSVRARTYELASAGKIEASVFGTGAFFPVGTTD